MHWMVRLALGVAGASLACVPQQIVAGGTNPDGYGLYSPLDPHRKGRPGVYRYDPRSWYYQQPSYYPYYYSGYWVPRPLMRYRYRYTYFGPRYRYYPAWGHGFSPPCCN